MPAIRSALASAPLQLASNAGLILDSYLPDHRTSPKPTPKEDLFGHAVSAISRSKEIYAAAFERWRRSLQQACLFELKTRTRMAVGLGAKGVLESGLALHPIYGTPFIPGSSIKGVCSHFAHDRLAPTNPDLLASPVSGPLHKAIFGTNDEEGFITFFDAWILPEDLANCLIRDIITPHHTKYFEANQNRIETPGLDEPVPVPFLSIKKGVSFLFAIEAASNDSRSLQLREFVASLLVHTLWESGIGSKTRSGYGRLDFVGEA